jgi:diguanylate cyclase (GGDEF)-like protein/putative nucleotidyltransferase with HDIG domain
MTWAELPAKLKIFISFLAMIAFPIAVWAGWSVLNNDYDTAWIILAVLTLLTLIGFQYLPSANTSISIGDAYLMAIAMMFGTAPCIITTFCHTLALCTIARKLSRKSQIPLYRVIFNISSEVCVACIYSNIFHTIYNNTNIVDMLLPAVLMVTTYFLINSFLLSIAVAWSVGEKVVRFWSKNCMPLAIDFSVSFVAAIIIVAVGEMTKSQGGIFRYSYVAAAPLIAILYGWNKVNIAKKMEAEKHLKEQEQLYLRTVESLALAVDAKDQTTYGHIRRVHVYATKIAHLCGITDPNELKAIETGSLLHDIGKLAIDDYILNKPGKLTQQEFEKVKMHSAAGAEILKQIDFPFPVEKCVRYHHERYDGKGYPDGLKGDEIPLGARILTIADAFDAIRYSRPYKLPMSTQEALEIMKDQSGLAFDPNLIQLFTQHVDEIEREAKIASENVAELSFRKYFENVNQDLLNADISSRNLSLSQDIPAELLQVAEFCSTAIGHFDLQEFLPILARRIERLVPFSTCAFYLGNDTGSIEAVYVQGAFSDDLKGHRIAMGKGISGWVTAHRRPMTNTVPLLDFHGIKGDFSSYTDTLVVPVVHDDETLGAISLYAQDPISYNQNDLTVLQIMAASLAPMVSEAQKRGSKKPEDVIDPTTQIHRISYLTAIGPQLISTAIRNRAPISLIYLEIRNLYQIVRIYGGNTGKTILKKIAYCVKKEIRETDILVRYGHQGFVALLPGVRIEHARRCVLRLKQQVRNEVSTGGGQNFSIDCSAGISSFPKDGSTIFDLLQSESKLPDGNVIDFYLKA